MKQFQKSGARRTMTPGMIFSYLEIPRLIWIISRNSSKPAKDHQNSVVDPTITVYKNVDSWNFFRRE